jgi:hypothetical protein
MTPGIIAYSIVCVFGAAIVRGYSGFGFSLLVITALSLAMPPAEFIPSIFMMEIAASLHMLPGIWREIHWRSIALLLAGCLVATPLGVWLLASVPVAPMKVALAIFVIVSAILLYRGFAFKRMPGRVAAVSTGAAVGLLNGAFGIAGPPVILFYFSSPAGVAVGRASIIAFFIGTDSIGLPFLANQGLITLDSFWRFLIFLPVLLAGVWLGARGFRHADPARFRQWTLIILMVLAALTGIQGLLALFPVPIG